MLIPTALLVAEDALGSQFEVEVGSAALKVTLPALPSNDPDEFYMLVCPLVNADDMVELMSRLYGHRGGWGGVAYGKKPGFPRPLASYVRAVALEAVLADNDCDPPLAAWAVGEVFDVWWSDVLAWLELWTPQHLIPDANAPLRSRGHVFDMRSEPPELTGWSHGDELRMYGSEQAVTHAMLASAFSRAAQRERPPLQWLLLCRAERLRDQRQALLNIASAAEVALAECVHTRLGQMNMEARERIIRNTNGIVGLVQLVEVLDSVPLAESRRSRIANTVARPRNDAAHRGITPSIEEAGQALRDVRSLLTAYTPPPAYV